MTISIGVADYQGKRILSISRKFDYLFEKNRSSRSLLRIDFTTISGVAYPKHYYYSLGNLGAFTLG